MKTAWVLILEATDSPLVGQVTAAWLAACADVCQIQLNRDVAPLYGGAYAVRVGADSNDVKAGESVFSLVDALPAAPGAIAYHDDSGNDVPVAFLALTTCNSLKDVSTAISHELCEAAGDDACNLFADGQDGFSYAFELCDAVESNSYQIDGVDVSDFLLPSFFEPAAVAPFTFVQLQGGPGAFPSAGLQTAAGGYQIRRKQGTGETQVTADAGSKRGALCLTHAHSWSSRAARRGVK